ncbi:MAG: flavocytochrome c [Coriobacteriia bacterium]|nr:flavocytochrome c [Coriobacteriia bacterium]
MPYVSNEPKWDQSFDVVVIGTGYAGLAAAYEASAWAKSVVVLEKMAYTGGNSRIAGGGYCCWDSKLKFRQKLGLGEDSWQLHAADTLAAGGGYGSQELVEVMCQEAPAGLDMLVDAGIEFRNSLPRIGGHSAYRSYQMADNGSQVMDKLEAFACQRGNVTIVRKAAVDGIYRLGETGAVVGVSVDFADGGRQAVQAKERVVVATGGYAADVELRSSYKPGLTAAYNCTNHKGATGEVIRFAKEIGADTSHMEFVQLYPCANPKTGGIDQGAFLCFSGTGYGLVYVNKEGRRFVSELGTREQVSNAQIGSGEGPSYSILNDRIFAALGIGDEDVERMVRSGRAHASDTLAGLAEAAGFDPSTFVGEIEAHNAAIAAGEDPAFGKPMTSAMIPLEEGRFYAIAQWPSVHYCMGGLRIDPQTRVLDVWGKPIAGLHAAGECCGGLHGIDRLGGNGIAECVVFGRRAGLSPQEIEEL